MGQSREKLLWLAGWMPGDLVLHGVGGRLFEVGHLKVLFRGGVVGGGGRLFEAGRLLNFSTFRVGAYSRWALIRGWALNRINTVD